MIKKKTITLLIMLFSYGWVLFANTQPYPQQNLSERMNLLQQRKNVTIGFDENMLKKVTVPPLDDAGKNTEELIVQSLKNTEYAYKKIGERSYIILLKDKNNPPVTQEKGHGNIKGTITDENKDPMIGVAVRVKGGTQGGVTDINGHYNLNLPAGNYELEVTYMGYQSQNITDVRIVNGQTVTLDLVLKEGVELQEVVISAVRKSRSTVPAATISQLTQEMKTLNVVASGISSEQISKTADRNAAQAVQRVSGVSILDDKFIIVRGLNPRYNLTYLNDNVAPSTELDTRAFALDLIPSRVIDKILVMKSPAPEYHGDATGGIVKIYTKEAQMVKHFDIDVQLGYRPGVTFNNILTGHSSKTDWMGFDDGQRKLPSVVPGYGVFSKAQIKPEEYAEHFSPYLQSGYKKALPLMQLTANYYDAYKIGGKYLGMLTSFSYKNEPQQYDVERMSSSFSSEERMRDYSRSTEKQSTQAAQWNLLQNFTFRWNDNQKFFFNNFLLQQGQDATIIRTGKSHQSYFMYLKPDPNDPEKKVEDYSIWKDNVTFGKYNRNIIFSYVQRFLYSGNLGGTHSFNKEKHSLRWNLGYTYSRQSIPDQRIVNLKTKAGGYIPERDAEDPELNWTADTRVFDTGRLSIRRGIISRTWTRNEESVYNGSTDYTWHVMPQLTLNAGTHHQWEERVLFRRVYTVNEGDVSDAGFPFYETIGIGGHYIDYGLVHFTQPDLANVWSKHYLRNDESGLKVIDRTVGSDSYKATEQNNAGYLSANIKPFGDMLEIYGGARVEYNRQKVAGAMPPAQLGQVNTPRFVDIKTTDILPSVTLNFRPLKQLVFRAAFGKTVNRPEFRELSPYQEYDLLNNQNVAGNSRLKPAKADNYDARIEWYPREDKGEMISVGAFYKKITNPIERMVSKDLFYNTPQDITFANAQQATIKGLEFDARVNLDFIPVEPFKHLAVVANYSLINSLAIMEKDTLSVEGKYHKDNPILNPSFRRRLQGQAPYLLNLGLYYEQPDWGTKVGLTYMQMGPRIYAAANGKPAANQGTMEVVPGNQGSIIELGRNSLDFSFSQKITAALQMKFTVQNLLNRDIVFVEDENFTYEHEPFKWATPDMEKVLPNQSSAMYGGVEGDIVTRRYNTGRYFTLSVAYSF